MTGKRVLTVGKITSRRYDRIIEQHALSADAQDVLSVIRYQARDAPPALRTALFSAANALWATARRSTPVL